MRFGDEGGECMGWGVGVRGMREWVTHIVALILLYSGRVISGNCYWMDV